MGMNVDLQEVNAKMSAGRKVLQMLQDDEKIAVRHNFNQIKMDAMKDVQALGVAAKKAARDWKKDAGATEKVESKANLPEKIYEGNYEKSEISSEEQAIRAEKVRDRATRATKDFFEHADKVLEALMGKGSQQADKQQLQGDMELLGGLKLYIDVYVGFVASAFFFLFAFAFAVLKFQRRRDTDMSTPLLPTPVV